MNSATKTRNDSAFPKGGDGFLTTLAGEGVDDSGTANFFWLVALTILCKAPPCSEIRYSCLLSWWQEVPGRHRTVITSTKPRSASCDAAFQADSWMSMYPLSTGQLDHGWRRSLKAISRRAASSRPRFRTRFLRLVGAPRLSAWWMACGVA